MSYPTPNYTQIPNTLLDEHLSKMKEAELRVTLAIARQTLGWHKKEDKISLSQLVKLTGLTRQGVANGISDALERGVIKRESSGQGFVYRLSVDSESNELVNVVDQSSKNTSQRSRPELVNVVDQLAPKLVNVVDTQKKDINKRKKDNVESSDSTPTDSDAGKDDEKVTPEHQQWFEALCWLVFGHKDYALLSKTDK